MSCLFLFITSAEKLTPMASEVDSDDCSRYAVGNCLSDARVWHASLRQLAGLGLMTFYKLGHLMF